MSDEFQTEMTEEAAGQSFMEKFQEKLEEVVNPIAEKVGGSKHVMAIRDAMIAVIPFTVIGGITILLACPPVTDEMLAGGNIFYNFMAAWNSFAGAAGDWLWTPYNLTLGCLALYVSFGVGYYLARSYKKNGLLYGLVCLVCFLVSSGALADGAIQLGSLGSTNVFGGMVTSIIVVELSRFLEDHNITIRLPKQVPSNIAAPFTTMISSVVCLYLFMLLNNLSVSATGSSFCQLIYSLLTPILVITNSTFGVLLLCFLVQFVWFFGIHASVVLAIAQPIMIANIAANAEAYAAGQALPYIFADGVTSAFGITIANLALVTLMCAVCKSAQTKSIGRLSIVPLFFGITEPFVFGTPIIMNPYMFVPFCIVPVLNCLVYCILANLGIMGKIFVELPWTTPSPIWGWLSTGRISGLIFFIVMFAVDLVLIMPFIKAYDAKMVAEESLGVDAEV